ncbi:hypothetical protein HZS_5470 [Henneguya salminicola]|nr:hypothetical protein HZS_5470 [Henneguya salminicola]
MLKTKYILLGNSTDLSFVVHCLNFILSFSKLSSSFINNILIKIDCCQTYTRVGLINAKKIYYWVGLKSLKSQVHQNKNHLSSQLFLLLLFIVKNTIPRTSGQANAIIFKISPYIKTIKTNKKHFTNQQYIFGKCNYH